MKRKPELYLKDILASMQAIEGFVQDVEFKDFKVNDEKSSAVIRKFEVIGEAAKNVPEEVKRKYPETSWRDMMGMRDKLIHFYFGVNYEIVWQTIKDIIPQIKPLIQNILLDLQKGK